MVKIVYRLSLNWLRSNRRHTFLSTDDIPEFSIEPFRIPDNQIISREEVERINKVIAGLPDRKRHVFFLAYIEELPYTEIAAMLNISVRTIYNHVHNSLKLIAQALERSSGIR